MAITKNGLKLSNNALAQAEAIDGYTIPIVVEITNPEYTKPQILNVEKGSVDNATPSVGMAALVTALEVLLDADVDNDFDITETGETHSVMTDFKLKEAGLPLSDGQMQYECEVKTLVKITT